jgi:hypothetical protein
VKQGNADALALLGADHSAEVRLVELRLDRDAVAIGEEVAFTLTLELACEGEVDVVSDYRVHYIGERGVKAPKVFKLTRRITLTREHAFAHVSIRRIHPGPHTVDVQVNGRMLGAATLDVLSP